MAEGLPGLRSWQLSTVGDWDSVSTDGFQETRGHNAVHELLVRHPEAGAPKPLAYDNTGNLVDDGEGQIYSWDPENLLRQAVVDGDITTYRYDALGRRVVKDAPGHELDRLYVCAGAQVVTEYASPGTPQHVPLVSYVYASYVDDPVVLIEHEGASGSYDTYYYHSNHLYSVAALTNAAGSVVERYGYDAYGESVVTDASGTPLSGNVSSVGNPYRFTGRRLDGETGLMYFRTRTYDGQLGRFLNRMPWFGMGGSSSMLPVFPGVVDSNSMEMIRDVLSREATGSYIQKRFSMYQFMGGAPRGVEPYSCWWLASTFFDEMVGQGAVDEKGNEYAPPNSNCLSHAMYGLTDMATWGPLGWGGTGSYPTEEEQDDGYGDASSYVPQGCREIDCETGSCPCEERAVVSYVFKRRTEQEWIVDFHAMGMGCKDGGFVTQIGKGGGVVGDVGDPDLHMWFFYVHKMKLVEYGDWVKRCFCCN